MARPDGNITGFTQRDFALAAKSLELLGQLSPQFVRIAVLRDATTIGGTGQKAHGAAFQERIRTIFGAEPEFQYFETPIVIDNNAKQVIDEAA